MKVRKTNHEDDLKFKEDEFLNLSPSQRLEINHNIKERMFKGVHQDWTGMKVVRVVK